MTTPYSQANVVDLTHTITEDMPVYPGTDAPIIEQGTTVAKEGFAEKKLTFFSHVGTHMDAPAHIFEDKKTLDALPVSTFTGPACVIDVSGQAHITLDFLKLHEDRIGHCDFVIFSSGHEKHWGTEAYFSPFPTLDEEAAKWISTQNLKGLGIDAISFDTMDVTTLFIHEILLGNGLVLIENLKNLDQIKDPIFTFVALPLKIVESDGSPIRAIAILP
ncbi:cyclase family protein [Halodesulfovibrio marinisediminis]|uniref:Kynurenine formamidase n=1 Tax=Halodesulfovibrio marinisediminis DSM 17456 TaxID=1121457 RepID=A0A1N6J3Q1_9BACT|nr:cyclase family protein [Halodesulfovibrio marinisediminis]SIO39008.1 Kynurenine formamidase [Halodesulfovibrio marinisediminis DSM 17456]